MSDERDLKDEIKKLKDDLEQMKQRLKEMTENAEHRHKGFYIDINGKMSDYFGDIMESVAEGIRGELKRSILISPHSIKITSDRGEEPSEKEQVDPAKIAAIMSALGQEHRIKILRELMDGGKYVSELQSNMPEITASTLSSHLDILQRAGLVVQERERGRYLISLPGRMAYKMANAITRQRDKTVE
jgi:DNA-binding transcriptional ArsR family regulator